MQVRDGMSDVVLTLGPGHTLREAARQMSERRVGAAVVVDPEAAGPAIITERDILTAVGRGEDPERECVRDHITAKVVTATPTWSLEEAACAMVRGGFRHLVVVDGGDVAGIVSMRDIVRCWTDDGSVCEVPSAAESPATA